VDIDALLSANTKTKPGGRCMVGTVLAKLDGLDKPTKAKLMAALADRERFSADGLAAVFTGLGYEMSRSPVERHRRGQCQCPAAT
jgi:hypothetical protein